MGRIDPKILSYSRAVKGSFACSNWLHFQAKVEHLHLKCCILGENPENKSAGSNIALAIPPMKNIISTWRLIVSGL